MFIKDNSFDIEQKLRLETRAATPSPATINSNLKESGFTDEQLKEIATKVKAAFPLRAQDGLFNTWIDNLFIPISQAHNIDITELNKVLATYIKSFSTRDLVQDIIDSIVASNGFYSSANAQKLSAGKIANKSDFEILKSFFNDKGATPDLVERLNAKLAGDTIIGIKAENIAKNYINTELAKYGVSPMSSSGNLATYLNSADWTSHVEAWQTEAFANAKPYNDALPMFVSQTSFETGFNEALKKEINGPASSSLADAFFEEISDYLKGELAKLAVNHKSPVSKKEALALTSYSRKLTIDELENIIPGTKAFFSDKQEAWDKIFFSAKMNAAQTKLTISADFSYKSATPIDLLATSGKALEIDLNDDTPVVQLAKDELIKIIRDQHVSSNLFNEKLLLQSIDAIDQPQKLAPFLDGTYHDITAADLTRLTGVVIDEAAWAAAVKGSFEHHIQIKFDVSTGMISYRVRILDTTSVTTDFQERLVTIGASDTGNSRFKLFSEDLSDIIKARQSLPQAEHNLYIVSPTTQAFDTSKPVGEWFLNAVDGMEGGALLSRISQIGSLYGNEMINDRYKFRGVVDHFNPLTDRTMTIHVEIIDKFLLDADGNPRVSVCDYTMNAANIHELESTVINDKLIKAFNSLTGTPTGQFSDVFPNPPATVSAPPTPGAITDLGREIEVHNPVIVDGGVRLDTFRRICEYFGRKHISIGWKPNIETDSITKLRGLTFTYSIQYYDDIFFQSVNPPAPQSFDRSHFRILEHTSATETEKQEAMAAISKEARTIEGHIKNSGADPTHIQLGLDAVAAIEGKAKNDIAPGKVNGISKEALDAVKAHAIAQLHKILDVSNPWLVQLAKMFGGKIPADLLKVINKDENSREFFKKLVESGVSLESIKMLAENPHLINELSGLNISAMLKVIDGMKTMHDNYKYSYLGLGIGLGAAGLLSGGVAASSIMANQKLKKINNRQMKMRGTKIVATISTMVSLATIASSVAFMILFFIDKGGF